MQRSIGRLLAIGLAAVVAAFPGTAVMAQDARPDRVETLIEAAEQAQQNADWREAIAAWKAVTEAEPDNGTAWFNLGYCLHADGQLEKAMRVHKRAAEFDRFEGIALYNLGCAYALAGREGQAFDALEASAKAGFDVAGSAAGDSDLDSLRDDPRFEVYAHGRRPGGGMSFGGGDDIGAMIGEVFGAIRSFLAENAPKTEEMFLELAEQAAKTMQMLHKELSENEQLAPLARMLEQWMGGGRDHHATAGREHAHAHDAHDAHDGHDDSAARSDDRDHDEALPRSERPGARPGQDLEALAQTAQRHQRAGEWKEAIAAWKTLLDRQPDIAGAWFSLGYALHANGDLEEAVKVHKKAAQYDEFEGIATYNLGCAYALLGQKDRAFRALRAAHDAGFDIADAMPGDSDLDSLRDDSRYEDLLDHARAR